jgi:hypothetical protein
MIPGTTGTRMLRDQELGAGVDFALEVVDVGVEARRLVVLLWIASAADA